MFSSPNFNFQPRWVSLRQTSLYLINDESNGIEDLTYSVTKMINIKKNLFSLVKCKCKNYVIDSVNSVTNTCVL